MSHLSNYPDSVCAADIEDVFGDCGWGNCDDCGASLKFSIHPTICNACFDSWCPSCGVSKFITDKFCDGNVCTMEDFDEAA